MKTEISRDSHQPQKRYSGVYQQQGRMLTDADWNELVEILKERLNDALKDVVGKGSPLHRNVVNNETDPPHLQWGYVHVDGILCVVRPDEGATLQPAFEYDHQQDFPSAPTPTGDYILYADVWERTVTHLMDERLRDKGLHGADTCTRKQTMAQVKWCPYDSVYPANPDNDPEQSAKNPAKGDAKLSIGLLEKSAYPDPCDPCADQIKMESKTGNYLFRVEVHDVKGDANDPSEITLKWSSENAAEQHALKNATGDDVELPAEFKSGQWAYEFFDETSERHLGIHLAPDFTPSREELTEGYPDTVPTRSFVRRWDGYCRLKKENGNWGVVGQFDRFQSPPFTVIADGKLTVNLDAQTLTLTLNSSFVAGDYWLADVREAEHDPLDPEKSKLIENEPPHGIEHHYLTLGKVVGGVLRHNPEADRKYAFPPLTEMTRMFMAGGDGQEVVPGDPLKPLPQPLRVAVANGEWPVAGASVRFQAVAADESLTPLSVVETNSDGIAKYVWTTDAAIDAFLKVKATLVDPDDSDNDLDHPPVYFNANLVSADQVAYESVCETNAANTVHKLLVEDTLTPPDRLILGADGYYTVKEVLDALLCRLKAKHIPYNPNENPKTTDRWKDIKEQQSSPGNLAEPNTVQEAIDDLIIWLESSDIRYQVPECGSTESPTVRSSLGISAGTHKIDEILDKLLCHFKATELPIDRSVDADLCDKLRDDAQVKTVQDAINAICRIERGGCAVTVGEGGTYSTLEAAFNSEEFKKKSQIAICLLPGPRPHSIEKLDVSGKQSISITGHGAVILVHGQLSLEAGNVTLRGIHFSVIDKVSTGTGSITLSSPHGGNVVVEHCRFSRVFNGKAAKWRSLVTVGKLTNLTWVDNHMFAVRQDEEIRSAAIPKREAIPEASLDAYDALEAVWRMDPYDDPGAFEARATAVAEKISGLTSATRGEWYVERPVTLISKLPIEPVRISLPPGTGIGRLEPTPGRGGLEPIPGRVTPRSLPGVTARLTRLAVVSEVSPRGEVKKFFELLKSAEAINVGAIADAISTVAALVNRFDYALALESNDVRGWITNNDISGYVALHNNQDKAVQLSWASTIDDPRKKNKNAWASKSLASDLSPKYQLSLHGNNFTAVHSMIPQDTLNTIHEILDTGEIPPITIQAYDSLTVRDNIFYEGNNSFISNFLNVSGNQFPNSAGKGKSVVAYTLGFSGVFLGSQALGRINAIIEQILHQKDKAANLLRIV